MAGLEQAAEQASGLQLTLADFSPEILRAVRLLADDYAEKFAQLVTFRFQKDAFGEQGLALLDDALQDP